MTTAEAHLSIGEVLSLLQAEFPDVTISKIRFLESQGLLDPERTPSGYRKFYEADVERLRWILEQQRDHFLPLKVIKDRLQTVERGAPPPLADEPEAVAEPTHALASTATASGGGDADPPAAPVPASEPPRLSAAPSPSTPPQPVDTPGPTLRAVASPLDAGPTDVSLTLDELLSTAGIDAADLAELERFGLITAHQVGADNYYDGDCLVVARSAGAFKRFGIEARHLRMYKVASEREAGFLEQVVMPLRKQRNPESRRRAVETVAELAGLGRQLHAALLRQALDKELG